MRPFEVLAGVDLRDVSLPTGNPERRTLANAALVFEPEAYSLAGAEIKGRNAAGHGFLRGFARYAQVPEFVGYFLRPQPSEAFVARIREAGRAEPCRLVDARRNDVLASIGCLYRPDPVLARHAWARGWHGHRAWSLCGITHTTATTGVMDAIAEWLTAPLQAWDAVICPSAAVRSMVVKVLEGHGEYLRARLGASRLIWPQLPVIPLGVAAEDYEFGQDARNAARNRLQVAADTIVVLFVGRLSFHGKAHPLAMYQALEAAAAGRAVVLIECGWHGNAHIAQAFAEAARVACASISVISLDGRSAEQRATAWKAADIFCSLSDNIQETFGLTPLEAMAAGLPTVVSDWNGYKETVRDGVDGFRIPATMPSPGLGLDLARRYGLEIDGYDVYSGYVSQLVAVDVVAATQAFKRLFDDAPLRRQMGAAGKKRVAQIFDWKMIIPRYQELWSELADIRKVHAAVVPETTSAPAWPARRDPFDVFAAYPTRALSSQTRLRRIAPDASARLERWRVLDMVSFALPMLPTAEECDGLLACFDQTPVISAGDLVAATAPARRQWLLRSLTWLLKMGVLAIEP